MGGCFSVSDIKGGQEAVGGVQRSGPIAMAADQGTHNDAVDYFYTVQGFQPLFTQVELSLSATNLLDLDIVSKSDPMAIVYLKKRDGNLQELGRTEVILNNLNPSWIGKIPVSYQFEMVQPLVIHIYDIDTKYHNIPVKALNLPDQDFIGEANCALSEVFDDHGGTDADSFVVTTSLSI